MNSQQQRATGRTTRMLREAERLASEGQAVYVIAATERERQRLRHLVRDDLGISIENTTSLLNLDWDTIQLRGAYPNCIVLVDHFAIELAFPRVLQMYHRFDEDCGSSTDP